MLPHLPGFPHLHVKRLLDWQNNNSERDQAFWTFFRRRCTTTKWKCMISRFVEDGNTRQQLSFSFPELWYSSLEFNSEKKRQNFKKIKSWNKSDEVWSSADSLFGWNFRCRCGLRWLNSLILFCWCGNLLPPKIDKHFIHQHESVGPVI